MSGCRIGRVRLKGGGELRLLPAAAKGHDERALEVLGRARMMADFYRDNPHRGQVEAFVMVALDSAGSYYGDIKFWPGPRVLNNDLTGAAILELVRQMTVTDEQCKEFSIRQGWLRG